MKTCCFCGQKIALDSDRCPSCGYILPQSEILTEEKKETKNSRTAAYICIVLRSIRILFAGAALVYALLSTSALTFYNMIIFIVSNAVLAYADRFIAGAAWKDVDRSNQLYRVGQILNVIFFVLCSGIVLVPFLSTLL